MRSSPGIGSRPEKFLGGGHFQKGEEMKIEKLDYDPEEVLVRAINLWMREGDREQPSFSDSEVDLEKHEVHLRNVKGLLSTYKIMKHGYLRRHKLGHEKR